VAALGHRPATSSSASIEPGSKRRSGFATIAYPEANPASPAFAAAP
jgi:hypothetical protein